MDKSICTCVPGLPPCSYHDPEREAERRDAAKVSIEAFWARYFTEKEKPPRRAAKVVTVLLALCLGGWHVIAASQLGRLACGGSRKAVA